MRTNYFHLIMCSAYAMTTKMIIAIRDDEVAKKYQEMVHGHPSLSRGMIISFFYHREKKNRRAQWNLNSYWCLLRIFVRRKSFCLAVIGKV